MGSRKVADAFITNLFSADTVLPAQFFKSRENAIHRSPERALMWATFADGIQSYWRTAGAATSSARVEFLEAERWVFVNDWEWPFSFVNLCEAFDFSAQGLRQALLRRKNEQAAATRPRRRFRPFTIAA